MPGEQAHNNVIYDYIETEEKLHNNEVLPINIEGSYSPSWGSFLIGVALPLSLGILMIWKGRCEHKDSLDDWLCESPPFGEQAQNVVSLAAGSGLLFEAMANLFKYIIMLMRRNTHDRQQQEALINREVQDSEEETKLSPPAAEDPSNNLNPKPVSPYTLPFWLFRPYLIGLVDNVVFTLGMVRLPFCIPHRWIKRLHDIQEHSHLYLINNNALTIKDLHRTTHLLNKAFIGILFLNGFSQVSGLLYRPKLIILVALVSYVFFRQLTSIETVRLIRQQNDIQKTLAMLQLLIVKPLKAHIPSDKLQQFETFEEKLDKAAVGRPLVDTRFLTSQDVEQLFKRIMRFIDEIDEGNVLHFQDKMRFKYIMYNKTGIKDNVDHINTSRFFYKSLPKQPAQVSHSSAVGMALIIINLFLPNLVLIASDSPLASTIVSNTVLSLGTFMPLNGLTEWENELWGHSKIIREDTGRKNFCSFFSSFLAYLVVNLPKLQGFVGAAEGVGISVGDTQIPLVCESLNMFFATLRSAITLHATIAVDACKSDDPSVKSIAKLARIM